MENGQEFGSHWGLRGSEDLGNGLKLDFVLESGIESDTGNLDTNQGGRLLGREAQMTFSGSFGALSFGRMPIFGSVLGANGLFRAIEPLFANYTTGFSTSNATASMWTRVDNAIFYKTPTFAGFTAKSNLFRGGFQSFRVLHERVPQNGIIQQDFWHS